MKFIIKRTSDYGLGETSPIKGAYLDKFTNVDVRTIGDPSEFAFKRDRDEWYLNGTNHRLINGKIARDLGDESAWVVNIETLEELMELKKECREDIIISTSYIDYSTPEIEIYDDYRE